MKQKYKPSRANESMMDLYPSRVEPFQVLSMPINTSHIVNVDEDFEDVRQFENIVHILDGAQAGDIMEIKLSTSGGALNAILPLLAAMDRTNATVFVHAVSDVASAGTFLLMKADDVYINPYVTIMCHQVQFGSAGAGSSVEAHVAHTMKASKTLIHDMYKDFFTEKEIDAMLAGKDFYMNKEEFDSRYERRRDIREEEMERQETEDESTDTLIVPKKRSRKKGNTVESNVP